MVQIYNKLQSTLAVDLVAELTLAGSEENLVVVDLTSGAYARGFHDIGLFIQNASLAGALTITVYANTAANGSGTDVLLLTATVPSSSTDAIVEVKPELVSHKLDRESSETFAKSLVFKVNGTASDTVQAAVIGKTMKEESGLNTNQVSAVS